MSFKVVLYRNDTPDGMAESLQVQKNWTMVMFNKKAGEKLKMKAKRVFLPSGQEVSGVDEMAANQILFISKGEGFYKHSSRDEATQTLYLSVLGTGGVGKSALTLRFVRDFFVKDWDPTVEDAYKKAIDVDEKSCTVDILDTAGQEDFESLRPSWMQDKDGYLFVYSLDQPQSLDELKPFFELHSQINEGKKVALVIAANKKDIASKERMAIAREAGMAKAREIGARYIETSASTGENVKEAFEDLIRQIRTIRNPTPGAGGVKDTNGIGCCVLM